VLKRLPRIVLGLVFFSLDLILRDASFFRPLAVRCAVTFSGSYTSLPAAPSKALVGVRLVLAPCATRGAALLIGTFFLGGMILGV
jgi:hypothetical protein